MLRKLLYKPVGFAGSICAKISKLSCFFYYSKKGPVKQRDKVALHLVKRNLARKQHLFTYQIIRNVLNKIDCLWVYFI